MWTKLSSDDKPLGMVHMDIERVYVSYFVQYNPFLDIWDFFHDFLLDITV